MLGHLILLNLFSGMVEPNFSTALPKGSCFSLTTDAQPPAQCLVLFGIVWFSNVYRPD